MSLCEPILTSVIVDRQESTTCNTPNNNADKRRLLIKIRRQFIFRLQVVQAILSLFLVVINAVIIIEERILFHGLGFYGFITSLLSLASSALGIHDQDNNQRVQYFLNGSTMITIFITFYFTSLLHHPNKNIIILSWLELLHLLCIVLIISFCFVCMRKTFSNGTFV